MNFVYPLGSGSIYSDFELALSVYLLRKYCDDVNVVVVGSKPRREIKDIVFIPNENNKSRYVNSMSNLRVGREYFKEPFVLMNDDFFITEKFDKIHLSWDMKLKDRIISCPSHIYKQTLKNSLMNDDYLNYAVHRPMPVNDLDLFDYCIKESILRSSSFRVLYGNESTEEGIKIVDVKLKSAIDYVDWFSISDVFLTKEINRRWLSSLTQGTISAN